MKSILKQWRFGSVKYESGDKMVIIDKPKEIYDFAYYSSTEGVCILYYEGECNMQDSFGMDLDKVRRATDEEVERFTNDPQGWKIKQLEKRISQLEGR